MFNRRLSFIFMFLSMVFCSLSPLQLLGQENKPIEIPSFEETCKLYADDPGSAFELYSDKQVATKITIGEKVSNFSICMNNEDMFTVDIFSKPGYAVGCICNPSNFKTLLSQINPGDVISLNGEYQSIENKDFKEKGLICYITLHGCSFKPEQK
jgi:hypothetical protein